MDHLLPTLPPSPPSDLPWEAVQKITSQIFWAIAKSYQLTTQPHNHKQTSEEKFIHCLINTLPSPSSPLLPSHLKKIGGRLIKLVTKSQEALHQGPALTTHQGLKIEEGHSQISTARPPSPHGLAKSRIRSVNN